VTFIVKTLIAATLPVALGCAAGTTDGRHAEAETELGLNVPCFDDHDLDECLARCVDYDIEETILDLCYDACYAHPTCVDNLTGTPASAGGHTSPQPGGAGSEPYGGGGGAGGSGSSTPPAEEEAWIRLARREIERTSEADTTRIGTNAVLAGEYGAVLDSASDVGLLTAGARASRVFTRAAVQAGVIALADSPVPGVADVIAIGRLVIGIVAAGVVYFAARAIEWRDGTCEPCPPPPGPEIHFGHRHAYCSAAQGHWHWFYYSQSPLTCECRLQREFGSCCGVGGYSGAPC
jgi:hypothetical protein